MSRNEFTQSDSMFANVYAYLGLPLTREADAADLFVIGLPYDLGTSGRAGARAGPAAIRAASANLTWEAKRWPWDFELRERIALADYGDLEFPYGNHEALFAQIAEHHGGLLDAGKATLSFGGDHFVTLSLLRAYRARHGELALIHFDAHTDTYSDPEAPYYHGNMFYHAPRDGLIDPDHSIQIGIRTEYDPATHLFEVIDAAEANRLDAPAIAARIRARVGDRPCYLSFDIDCLDPAFAPGTGTPVAGGLASAQALEILRNLAGIDLVGMDLVEVAPAYDHASVTALAGATLGLEMLHVYAANRRT